MSSIDDSFLPDKFRIALPTSDIDNAKNDNSDMADQWSLDDTFPDELKQQKDMKKSKNDDVYRVPHSELTDSDDSAVGEDNPKNDDTADTLAILKELSDEMKIAHRQLEEIAIPKEDNVLADIAEEDEVSSPLPKPAINARGLFSCFADNTVVDIEQMNTKDMLTDILSQESDRIAADPGLGGRNLYEVRAPPGPLGILIDSSKDGPIIYSIKDNSPLKHLVEPGDVILSVDGVDTKSLDAVAVSHWISSKPSLAEQTLLMESKLQWNKYTITSSSDMSV